MCKPNEIEDVRGLAELLVRFDEQDRPREQGTLPSGRLSLVNGEREPFTVLGEDGEPVDTMDVPLLDEEKSPNS